MAKVKAGAGNTLLSGLTEIQCALVEGYALLHPERPARTKMLGWLNRIRKGEGKTGFTSDQLREAIEALIGIGLLIPSTGGRGVVAQGPTVVNGLVSPGCLAALSAGRAYRLLGFAIDEYEYMFSRYSARELPSEPGQLYLLLQENIYEFRLLEQYARLEVLSGQFDATLESRLPGNIWSWMVEPTAHPFLITLPDALRQTVCLSGLYRLCLQLLPAKPFRELCLQHAPDTLELVGICATTLIFEGEFEQAKSLLDTCSAHVKTGEQKKAWLVAKYSNEALIATLTGNVEEAQVKIDACLDADRAGTRKRNVFPFEPSFEIAILGLMLSSSPKSSQQFKALVKIYRKLRITSGMEDVYALVSHATEEHFVSTPYYRESANRHVDLILALSTRWHPKFNLRAEHDAFVHSLQLLLQQAYASGYLWVVAELLQVLEATAVRDSIRLQHTDELMAEHSAADLHKQLGTISLASLIKPLEAWEKNLRNLELLVPGKKQGDAQQKKSATTAKKRVVWQLLEVDTYVIEALPLEQTQGKSGWSNGRRISLQRLANNPDQVAGLSATDLKAVATIRKISGYGWGSGGTRYETDSRTVYQLIGHSSVVDENGEPVDVIERPAELRITENADNVHLQMYPKPSGQHYVANFETGTNRVYVTHFNAAQRRLFDVIPLVGMDIPASAKSRLLDVVASLSGDIQIQSDTAVAGSASIQGDTTPVLQLEIVDSGVQVRFKVEPLADTATLYDCGVGGAVVYLRKDGNSVAVSRHLQAEQDALQALLDQVPLLAMWFDGQHGATIDNIPDALEMLDSIQQQQVRCIWLNDKRLAITANADSSQLRLKIKSAEDWFSASGELNVDEEVINLSRLISLVKAQPSSRFVEVGSGEFVALSAQLRSQLQVLAAFSRENAAESDERQLHPLATLALGPFWFEQDSLGRAAGNGKSAASGFQGDKSWSAQVKRVRHAFAAPPELPATLQADLREYQLEGYQWLAQLGMAGAGACLADDMGLGKTLQSLALLVERAAGGAALVIAPTSVAGNWAEEAQRFAPTLAVTLYSQSGNTRKLRQKSLERLAPFSVIIASYGLLVSDEKAFTQVHWHSVVLDEAQAIKNAATKRAKVARQLKADMRIVTTGTPIQNNLMDLHSLFDFINPGLLGTRNDFHQRFALPIERDGNANVRQELQVLTAPFILRRLKRDVLKDLPSRTEINLTVELSEEEATLYETLRLEALEALQAEPIDTDGNALNEDEVSGAVDVGPQRFAILAQLMRLRRLCCNPKLIESDWAGAQSKLDLFNSTLQELLASRHKVLVFSQFVDHLQLIEAELKKNKIAYQYLDGSTPAKQRQQRVAAFQSGVGEVFLISLTAGGTGLNLTAADYVIHLDPWWNPAVEDQASDRAHRIGQLRPVTIYRMVTKGTIEAQIQELHGNKRQLAQSILSGTDKAKVDPEQLLELLAVPFAQSF